MGIAPGGADLLTGMALQSKGKETGRPPPAGGIAGQEISCTGTVEEFAGLMNQKAKDLGCESTYFVTPNGLDGSDENGTHSTTARDLALIMRYCISQSPCKEEFLEITRTKSYQFTDVEGSRNFSCNNHNAFLDMMDGALSGKTGFTADAGYCYVGALKDGDRTFIVALLACGWPNNKGYKWADTRKLMEYGIANYEYRNVWEDVKLPDIFVADGIEEGDPYKAQTEIPLCAKGKEELYVLLRQDESVEVKTENDDSLQAPVKAGEEAGTKLLLPMMMMLCVVMLMILLPAFMTF